jgi:hypothetical protein
MKISIAFAALLLTTLIACDKQKNEKGISELKRQTEEAGLQQKDNYTVTDAADYSVDTTIAPPAPPPGEPEKQKQPISKPIPNPDWDKKIIKTADLNIEIKEYHSYSKGIREKIKGLGGYMAQEEQKQDDYKIENIITIKVPVDQFDNAINQLSANVEKLNEKKITSQDVTAEYVDTRSRMEAKKQVRNRYMELLKQARNMQEILDVQSEINAIQEEIESAAGRIEYLGQSSAYSTINLTYYQVLNPSAKTDDTPGFGHQIADAFRTGWGWITELFIGIVSIWPLVIAIGFGIAFFRKNKAERSKEVKTL